MTLYKGHTIETRNKSNLMFNLSGAKLRIGKHHSTYQKLTHNTNISEISLEKGEIVFLKNGSSSTDKIIIQTVQGKIDITGKS